LTVIDPPYGIELDSEWYDRAGMNGPFLGLSNRSRHVHFSFAVDHRGHSAGSIRLLYIDLQGHAQTLSEHVGRAVPSPEGRHLALLEWNTATDAWMIEHF
jgi:hypothetical protein